MYNRDPVTPFELADKQRDGNPVPLSQSGGPLTISDSVTNFKHIYQCMLAKSHNSIKKAQVTQQKYHNIQTFNNPFSVGDKVLKKNMEDKAFKVKIKTKCTGPCTIVDVLVVGNINSRTDMGIFLNHIYPKDRPNNINRECLWQMIRKNPTQCMYQCRGNRCG